MKVPYKDKVSYVDLKAQYQKMKGEIDPKVLQVLAGGQYIGGEEVDAFEEALARFVGCKYALTCSSGTQALLVALMALGLKPEDEVITSPFTFIASAEMIHLLGAKPIYGDICPQSFHLQESNLETLLTPKTKILLPISLYGQVADMEAINTLAKEKNLFVLEDAAQSLGANYKGKKSGNLSHLAITSFYPSKPLGCCGDGGAVFTSSKELYHTMKMIRDHGSEQKYRHPLLGLNARLDAVQCVILSVKLTFFEWELKQRGQVAKRYHEGLSHLPLVLPVVRQGQTSSWAQYTLRVKGRDRLQQYLQTAGIPTGVHYPLTLPEQKAYGNLSPEETQKLFPEAYKASREVLSLPLHPYLKEEEQDRVIHEICRYFASL